MANHANNLDRKTGSGKRQKNREHDWEPPTNICTRLQVPVSGNTWIMMAEELAYALITPHSISKSRTGILLSRLISRSGLNLVAGMMFAPSEELADRYSRSLNSASSPEQRADQKLIRNYVLDHLFPTSTGKRERVLLLVFFGKNAVARLSEAVGPVKPPEDGSTIRGSYGEFITDKHGKLIYFEPAVLVATNPAQAKEHLLMWSEYSETDGGILEKNADLASQQDREAELESTLVVLKPDNFSQPAMRPGLLMDLFSKTGLALVGFKVHRLAIAEAKIFYGSLLAEMEQSFKQELGLPAKEALETTFGIQLPKDSQSQLAGILAPTVAQNRWQELIKFMTGSRPDEVEEKLHGEPGDKKIIALVYQGKDAVKKTRDVLGSTSPEKARQGTIRKEFGSDILNNAAHASDSPANAKREMEIVAIRENMLQTGIKDFYFPEPEDKTDQKKVGFFKKMRKKLFI